MPKVLPKRTRKTEAGFTLLELLVVILMIGILAAVIVPLYLGYTRDARLAEGKALVSGVLTSLQRCLESDTCATNSAAELAYAAQRNGLNAAGVSGDLRWTVSIPTALTLVDDTWTGGTPTIQAAGAVGTNVEKLVAAIFIGAGGVITTQCSIDGGETFNPC